jgi:hypothetical protein
MTTRKFREKRSMNELEQSASRLQLNPKRPVIAKLEQVEEIFSKARLVLRLGSPNDVFDIKEFESLRKEQAMRIQQFAELLEEMLVNEYGVCLVAVYSAT